MKRPATTGLMTYDSQTGIEPNHIDEYLGILELDPKLNIYYQVTSNLVTRLMADFTVSLSYRKYCLTTSFLFLACNLGCAYYVPLVLLFTYLPTRLFGFISQLVLSVTWATIADPLYIASSPTSS